MSDKPTSPDFFTGHYAYLWAVVNLFITFFGVLFLHWSLQPIIFLFWIEVMLNVASALIRAIGALDGKPFFKTLLGKIPALLFAMIMGAAMIMLAVSFTIGAFDENFSADSFRGISISVLVLSGNYLGSLLFNYFFNGRFRIAVAGFELMTTFVYLLVLICLIMALTQHLIPSLDLKNTPLWIGLTVIAVKFAVDFFVARMRASLMIPDEKRAGI